MEEKIKELDATLLEIKLIRDYLSQFKNYEITLGELGELIILCEGEMIRIFFLENVSGARWWSIYRHHADGTCYEQIDVLLYDEIQDNGYNRIIRYCGHIEDDIYSHIMSSCFSYLDDTFVRSWQDIRVVPRSDLVNIQYSKSMNLSELIGMADLKSSKIIKKEERENVQILALKLEKYN